MNTFLPRRRLLGFMVTVALLLLPACGFHLRGSNSLQGAFSTLSLQGLDGNTLRQSLVERLEKSGVMLTDNAPNTIVLLDQESEKRVSAYSSRAKSAAFELRRTIAFQLVSRNNPDKPLIPRTELMVRRQLLFREDQVVGKIEEEAQLWREMEHELAERIVRKIELLSAVGQ